jgi:hypothetical protein
VITRRHEVVGAAEAGLAWSVAGRVGRNEWDDAALAQRVDVAVRPVAGVGQHHLWLLLYSCASELALG